MKKNKETKTVELKSDGARAELKNNFALCMMVKNESLRIINSLNTVLGVVDSIIILDTGSTDDTIAKIRSFCEENKLPLHLKEEPFIDYSASRNSLLEFSDKLADYLLLLDCNDEVKEGDKLREFVKTYEGPSTGFFLLQSWWNGKTLDEYFNVRLVKTKNMWRFHRRIHEYIMAPSVEKDMSLIGKIHIKIFQDRTKDDDKSKKRFPRDRKILYEDVHMDKKDARSKFYLGQTMMCLGQDHLAYRYYRSRTTLPDFPEEIYHAYFHCGRLGLNLGHKWERCLDMFKSAYRCLKRVEPLLEISKYYTKEKKFVEAYLYCKQSIALEFPSACMLFVNKRAYSFDRYKIFAEICLFSIEELMLKTKSEENTRSIKLKLQEGIDAINIAIKEDSSDLSCVEVLKCLKSKTIEYL